MLPPPNRGNGALNITKADFSATAIWKNFQDEKRTEKQPEYP
jgi:hypothetical protein